jgi:hypothetical protein
MRFPVKITASSNVRMKYLSILHLDARAHVESDGKFIAKFRGSQIVLGRVTTFV